jgi:hypothetical protein
MNCEAIDDSAATAMQTFSCLSGRENNPVDPGRQWAACGHHRKAAMLQARVMFANTIVQWFF